MWLDKIILSYLIIGGIFSLVFGLRRRKRVIRRELPEDDPKYRGQIAVGLGITFTASLALLMQFIN